MSEEIPPGLIVIQELLTPDQFATLAKRFEEIAHHGWGFVKVVWFHGKPELILSEKSDKLNEN